MEVVGRGRRVRWTVWFSKGGQLGYMEIHAKNIPNLTDP
jgi:hypothetical protein